MVVASERFEALALRSARGFGLEDARIALVPHPIGGEPDAALRRAAQRAVPAVMGLFAGVRARREG